MNRDEEELLVELGVAPHDCTNPIVHACLAMWRRGECDLTTAALIAVRELSAANQRLSEQLRRRIEREVSVFVP